jgi:hypothetical protein
VKRFRVYKQEFKHKISYSVVGHDLSKSYLVKGAVLVGYINATSRDGAAEMVKTLTENGLLSNPALSH